MADTIGGLIDKLFTSDMKMWTNQELLYEIRRITFEEFKEKYFETPGGMEQLWKYLQITCDLNLQRNQLIDEIDQSIVKIIQSGLNGEDLNDGRNIQLKHKTY